LETAAGTTRRNKPKAETKNVNEDKIQGPSSIVWGRLDLRKTSKRGKNGGQRFVPENIPNVKAGPKGGYKSRADQKRKPTLSKSKGNRVGEARKIYWLVVWFWRF